MPPPNDNPSGAILLDVAGDSHGGDNSDANQSGPGDFDFWPSVWYRLEPASDMAVKVTIVDTSGDPGLTPEADIYSVASPPPASYGDLDDVGYVYADDSGPGPVSGTFLLQGGVVYFIEAYLYSDTFGSPPYPGGTFTISVEPADTPPNDHLADASAVLAGETVSGTTEESTVEPAEYDAGFDNGTPTVWHKYTPLGPGTITLKIEKTGGTWEQPSAIIYYSTDPNVTDFDDLTDDSADSVRPEHGLVEYTDLGGSLDPLDWTGYTLYFQIISNDDNGPSDTGSYSFTVNGPPEQFCLDAVDYINGASPFSSVVSGAVRETQPFPGVSEDPYLSWITDMEDTLTIPGDDILALTGHTSPGFYAVTLKCKNDDSGQFTGGFRRNGLAMYPGLYLTDQSDPSGPTAVSCPLTALAGVSGDVDDPNYIDTITTLWRLPVGPGDEIGVVVGKTIADGTDTDPIDIEQICFQRVADAVPGPIQDLLDVPEFPLGFSSHPFRGIWEQPTPDPEPTNERVAAWGQDMCVTDDGRVWCLWTQQAGNFTGGYKTGPILKMWDGVSWTLIDDDIEGLGVHRSTYGGGGFPDPLFHGPYGVTIDTDGTDLYMAWAHSASFGTNPSNPPYHTGVQPNGVIHVWKYDTGSGTFSRVGPELYANHTLYAVRTEAGSYDTTPCLRVSPGGRVFVGFADWQDSDAAKYRGVWTVGRDRLAYVAKLNDAGDDWIIQQGPLPQWIMDHPQAPANGRLEDMDWDGALVRQAESNIGSSGTATVDTRHGESAVKETQDGSSFPAPGVSISFVPQAGEWGFALTPAWTITGPGIGSYGAHVFKNGVYQYTASGISGSFVSSSTQWGFPTEPRYSMEFNGTTDTIEFRVFRTGVVDAVWIDEIVLYPSWAMAQIDGGRGAMDVSWVEDAQYHVIPLFDNPDEPEKPRVVYNYISNDPALHPIESFNEATASHRFMYAEWVDDSDPVMTRIWDSMLEDDLPQSVGMKTRLSAFDITLGHWQQGFSAYHDPESGRSFMHFQSGVHFSGGDVNSAVELTPDGPVMPVLPSGQPPNDARPVGQIGGGAYTGSELGEGSGLTWGWDTGSRTMAIDYRGNLWVAWAAWGAYGTGEICVAKLCDTGTGGWILGARMNLAQHESQYNGPTINLCMSPDRTKLYIFAECYMWDDPTWFRWTQLGVWEIDILEDQWTPLVEVELAGDVNMNYRWGGNRSRSGITRFHR